MDTDGHGINHGIRFVDYLYYLAAQRPLEPEWMIYAQDVHTLVNLLSLDHSEACEVRNAAQG